MKKTLIISAGLICLVGLSVFVFFSKSDNSEKNTQKENVQNENPEKSTQTENVQNVFLKLQVMTEEIPGMDSKTILERTAQVLEKRLGNNGIQNVKIELYDSSEIGLTIPYEEYYLQENTPGRIRRMIQDKGHLQFRETPDNISDVWEKLLEAERLLAADSTDAPIRSLLAPETYNTACIGYAKKADSAILTKYFSRPDVKNILKDYVLLWSAKPVKDSDTYELVAINAVKENEKILDEVAVKNARGTINTYGSAIIELTMTSEGARAWADLTGRNIGKPIAIVLDSLVYSYPIVQSRIDGGRSTISGNFTIEEAQDLADILESGTLPVTVNIIEEK